MWQLLAFGTHGTPERRYAVVDPQGQVHWAGANVHEAMLFIVAAGLAERMELDEFGGSFVRERWMPKDPSKIYQTTGPRPWGVAGE